MGQRVHHCSSPGLESKHKDAMQRSIAYVAAIGHRNRPLRWESSGTIARRMAYQNTSTGVLQVTACLMVLCDGPPTLS